jgi:hypothetical protein
MKPRLGHATLGIPHGVKDEAGAEIDVSVTIIHNCLAQRGYAAEMVAIPKCRWTDRNNRAEALCE